MKYEQFRDCKSVILPDGITSIEDEAFRGCFILESIRIPNSVKQIGNSAFRNCTALHSIIIPEGVTYIGKSVFEYCEMLGSITIPEGVTSIGECAFYGCDKLESITIPNSVKSIGESAFGPWLHVINFAGTKEEWKSITKDKLFDSDFYSCVVYCKDGDIFLNGRSADSDDNPEDYKRLFKEYDVWNDF